MSRKLLLCFAILLAFASTACAASSWWGYHASAAGLTNGRSDYSNARFYRAYMRIWVDGITVTEEHISLEGTMTVNGGRYSLIRDGKLQEFSGTSQTFALASDFDATPGDEGLDYEPLDPYSNTVPLFLGEADGGLNGVNVSWSFPTMPDFDGQGTVPNYRTTAEQLEDFVPYVEYIRNGSNVTGIRWRVVNPSSPDAAIEPRDYRMRFRFMNVRTYDTEVYNGEWINIPAGTVPEGTISFDAPIDESSIWQIDVRLRTYETESAGIYEWVFVADSTPELGLEAAHVSNVPLVNGKPDYNEAQFSYIEAYLEAGRLFVEAKHFTDEGRINVPGGGYTLVADGAAADVPEGTASTTYNLTVAPYIVSFWYTFMDYYLTDNQGRLFNFGGGAEDNLLGKTVSWTFPENLNMNGSAVIPNFMKTSEQLTAGAPYIELIDEGGSINKIDYKLVNARTMEEVTPAYNVELTALVMRRDKSPLWLFADGISGTWELSEAAALSEIELITVYVSRYDETGGRSLYLWNFTPAESVVPVNPESQDAPVVPLNPESPDVPIDPGNSSGGCEAGCALGGLLAAALFILKKTR